MRHLEVTARVTGTQASDLFPRLCDFAAYPALTDTVRSVAVGPSQDGRAISRWEVDFLGGVLRWTEEDRFQPETGTITFRQTEGDMGYFAGTWTVRDDGGQCLIELSCDFDLGLPAVGEYLDPIAEQALGLHLRSIVNGLAGGQAELG